MYLSSSYYFISICLFEQFNVVSKPQLNKLNYLQACGVQMPNTAVLEKSLPPLARTCMPKQRGQLSSTQISPVHPNPAQGQGESLLTAWGWVNSFHGGPLQGTSNESQSSAEQSKAAQLEGKNQCVNRPLGWLLSHHVVRLQAKTAHRPWAKSEVCSTCGFHRNPENMGRDHKHSWIPRVVPSLAETPLQSLPLAPGHPPPLLTGTLPCFRIPKGREQGPGHAEWGQQPQGMLEFIPHSPSQGKSQGWVTSQIHKATLLKQQGRGEKKSLHKTNPTGFPHSNPLPRVRYLHCFSHLLFWGAWLLEEQKGRFTQLFPPCTLEK